MIQSKFKSIQSKFKSKIIKFIDVKKIYIFENNNDDDNNNDDKSIFHNNDNDKSIFQQNFITFIKTFFVVNESINTNTFVVSFTFNTSILDNEIFQQHFITFIITNQLIIIFIAFDVFVFDKINDEFISIIKNNAVLINFSHFVAITTFDNINNNVISINFDHFAINFDQFVLFKFFENINEKLSIFFLKSYILFLITNRTMTTHVMLITLLWKKKFCWLNLKSTKFHAIFNLLQKIFLTMQLFFKTSWNEFSKTI